MIQHIKQTVSNYNSIVILGDKTLRANSFARTLIKSGISRVCILRGGFDAVQHDAAELIAKQETESKSLLSRFKFY
jgi:hypothetical protein